MDEEEEELRSLFEIESRERLNRLQQGLVKLEEQPDQIAATVDGLFREAHSLKGAARMMGLDPLETVTHRLEDLLGHLKRGRLQVTAEVVDKLFLGTEAASRLCQEAIERASRSTVNLAEVLTALDGGVPVVPAAVITTPKVVKAEAPAPSGGVAVEPTLQLDTLRVQASSLDALMTMTGELRASHLQSARRIDDAEKLIALWEEAARAARRGLPTTDLMERLGASLGTLRGAVYADHARLEGVTRELEDGVRHIRLVPLDALFQLCPALVRNLSRSLGRHARLEMEGGHQPADKRIVQELKDPLLHLIRNAVHHGSVAGRELLITLRARTQGDRFLLEVADNGRGLDRPAIARRAAELDLDPDLGDQAIFEPGFSTATVVDAISGRGVGLDVVRTALESLRGSVTVESEPGHGTLFRLEIPRTLSTTVIVLVRVGASLFGLPADWVDKTLSMGRSELETVGGKMSVQLAGSLARVVFLADLLGMPVVAEGENLVAVSLRGEAMVLLVEQVLGVEEVVPRPLGSWHALCPHLQGAALLGNGEVVLLLDPALLGRRSSTVGHALPELAAPPRVRRILLVEDSLTTRAQEKRILEGAGYEVTAAVDGADGWQKLALAVYDAVVSDIEMPNMDGLTLTARIRENARYKDLPVILVTSLASEEDRQRGFEVGADAYLPKPGLDPSELLEALKRLM